MFTFRNIPSLMKSLLQTLLVVAAIALWRVPEYRPDFGFISRPIGLFITQMYPNSTHLEATGHPPNPVELTLPALGESAIQEKSKSNLRFAMGINQGEIAKRFHVGLSIPQDTTMPIAVVPRGLTWNECEDGMSQLTAMHQAEQWVDGMTQAEQFLRDLDSTPKAYPEYRVLTAALAFQMAAMAGDAERAEHFGKLAMQLSRANDNYQLESIESSFYQVAGHRVDFAQLLAIMEALASDFEGLSPEEAVKRSEALVAACGSLPATSIFRLKADLFEALAKQKLGNNAFDDLRRFGAIQSNAEAIGNQVIQSAIEPIVAYLFKQIQGLVEAISEKVDSE